MKRSASFTDKVLSNAEYEQLKQLVYEQNGRFEAKVLAHGVNAVELRQCCVVMEPPWYPTKVEEATFDEKAQFQRLLETCRRFGFQQC